MYIIKTPKQTVYYRKNETILEALERTGHKIEYQCRQGYCGSCRLKLVQGDIRYIEMPLAYVSSDDFLPCCSMPASDIEVDSSLNKAS